MEYKAVESSQIESVGYDAETETLGIRFRATKKNPVTEYNYANVKPDLHAGLVGAVSVGKFFTEHIKQFPVAYPYTKVS